MVALRITNHKVSSLKLPFRAGLVSLALSFIFILLFSRKVSLNWSLKGKITARLAQRVNATQITKQLQGEQNVDSWSLRLLVGWQFR